MTERRGRAVSRRGLLGIFGVGARGFRDALQQEAENLAPVAAGGAAKPRQESTPTFRRAQRPPDETVCALLEESGAWGVDLRRYPLAVGRSWRVVGEGLAEPLLATRVSEAHVAVVGGECPVDGSDLLWLAFEDRVACPSCGSRWRLDGAVTRAPADCPIASFPAYEAAGLLRIRAV